MLLPVKVNCPLPVFASDNAPPPLFCNTPAKVLLALPAPAVKVAELLAATVSIVPEPVRLLTVSCVPLRSTKPPLLTANGSPFGKALLMAVCSVPCWTVVPPL